jgi:predicted O-linked N-acetylglucosamine transferase (SPINDLY family)
MAKGIIAYLFNRLNRSVEARCSALNDRAQKLAAIGRITDAIGKYRAALALDPTRWDAASSLAMLVESAGNSDGAIEVFDAFLDRNPEFAEATYRRANLLARVGRLREALSGFNEVILQMPNFAAAYCNRGSVLERLGELQEALASFDRALDRDPLDALAYSNKAAVLVRLGRRRESIEHFERALALNADLITARINCAHVYREEGQAARALAHYDRAIADDSTYPEAFCGRGGALVNMGRMKDASAAFDQALHRKPKYLEALIGKGNALRELRQYEDAIGCYRTATELSPICADAYEGCAFCLLSIGVIEAAIAHYERALQLQPNREFVLGMRRHAMMHICEWTGFDDDIAAITSGVRADCPVVAPFILLALSDSPDLQRRAAEIWVREKCAPGGSVGEISHSINGKIRVGYFSADFRAHPVALLIAELIERHDRERFEIIGFAFGPSSDDPVRSRLRRAFDAFVEVQGKSDEEIVRLSRSMGIDIAVDLGGFTVFARTEIFAQRVAPLQLSYLGYLGTMAASYMDYLVADPVLIDERYRAAYAEKIVYLPSYQVNDSHRTIADYRFSRMELGLPANGFVFACFNATYKLTPAVFEAWMRILARVEGSCLYLYVDNEIAQGNLQRYAVQFGADPRRLVFGTRIPLDRYLARFAATDLFLDTAPYNAGTTASDALFAGLPVLTRRGESMAARMAASLLTSIGLPELITTTMRDYEDMAVRLAMDPELLDNIRRRLALLRTTSPLFDAVVFTHHLEHAFDQMYRRSSAGLPPVDIHPRES